jgi:hypothetical protein
LSLAGKQLNGVRWYVLPSVAGTTSLSHRIFTCNLCKYRNQITIKLREREEVEYCKEMGKEERCSFRGIIINFGFALAFL